MTTMHRDFRSPIHKPIARGWSRCLAIAIFWK
jgi:hypothetical protein